MFDLLSTRNSPFQHRNFDCGKLRTTVKKLRGVSRGMMWAKERSSTGILFHMVYATRIAHTRTVRTRAAKLTLCMSLSIICCFMMTRALAQILSLCCLVTRNRPDMTWSFLEPLFPRYPRPTRMGTGAFEFAEIIPVSFITLLTRTHGHSRFLRTEYCRFLEHNNQA